MKKSSLEFSVESYVMELLATEPRLKGKTIRHFDDDRKADTDCIVIEATQAEEQLEGPRGNMVDVRCSYRSALGSRQTHESIVSAMRAAFTGASGGRTDAENLFANPGVLQLYPERITGDREQGKKLRMRSLTIPILAKLK